MARPTKRPAKRVSSRVEKRASNKNDVPAVVPEWAALNNRGNTRQEEGDLDGAVADFTEAITLEPEAIATRYKRGNARSLAGDLEGAIADYTDALAIDPDFAPAYQRRGLTRQRRGDLDGALADLDAAVRLAPEEPSALGERAALRALRSDFEGAIADCERALEIAPADWKHRANTEHLLHTLRKAETHETHHDDHDGNDLNDLAAAGSSRKTGKRSTSTKKKKTASPTPEREEPQSPAAVVEQILKRGGWEYQRVVDEEQGTIDYVTEAEDEPFIAATVVRLHEELERVVLYVLIKPKPKKERRAEVCELVTRANFGMGDGNFEMDLEDGTVRYKIALDFSDVPLSPLLVRNMIVDAMDTIEIYEEAFMRVIAGKAKAKAAIRAAEKAAEGILS